MFLTKKKGKSSSSFFTFSFVIKILVTCLKTF